MEVGLLAIRPHCPWAYSCSGSPFSLQLLGRRVCLIVLPNLDRAPVERSCVDRQDVLDLGSWSRLSTYLAVQFQATLYQDPVSGQAARSTAWYSRVLIFWLLSMRPSRHGPCDCHLAVGNSANGCTWKVSCHNLSWYFNQLLPYTVPIFGHGEPESVVVEHFVYNTIVYPNPQHRKLLTMSSLIMGYSSSFLIALWTKLHLPIYGCEPYPDRSKQNANVNWVSLPRRQNIRSCNGIGFAGYFQTGNGPDYILLRRIYLNIG